MRKLWITLPILFFVMYAESIEAKQKEIECLAQNIYHEARSESTAGRMAVALVTLNRVKDERFPNTICGVVKQTKYYPSGRIDLHSCQFSWYCDGKSDEPKDSKTWIESIRIADQVLNEIKIDVTDGALWYHADYIYPYWADHLERVIQIEDHIFYK